MDDDRDIAASDGVDAPLLRWRPSFSLMRSEFGGVGRVGAVCGDVEDPLTWTSETRAAEFGSAMTAEDFEMVPDDFEACPVSAVEVTPDAVLILMFEGVD